MKCTVWAIKIFPSRANFAKNSNKTVEWSNLYFTSLLHPRSVWVLHLQQHLWLKRNITQLHVWEISILNSKESKWLNCCWKTAEIKKVSLCFSSSEAKVSASTCSPSRHTERSPTTSDRSRSELNCNVCTTSQTETDTQTHDLQHEKWILTAHKHFLTNAYKIRIFKNDLVSQITNSEWIMNRI